MKQVNQFIKTTRKYLNSLLYTSLNTAEHRFPLYKEVLAKKE
jgi:hypothetical protein